VAIKDVISTRGIATTCGSKILENYVPPFDATTWSGWRSPEPSSRKDKTADDFAMGSSNENSAYGPVKNPLAPDHVPGGSSGGSAAVVAAGLAVASLGRTRRLDPAAGLILRRPRMMGATGAFTVWIGRVCIFTGPHRAIRDLM